MYTLGNNIKADLRRVNLGCYVGTFIALTPKFAIDFGMKLIVCEYLIFCPVTGCCRNELWFINIHKVFLQPPVISK